MHHYKSLIFKDVSTQQDSFELKIGTEDEGEMERHAL